MEETDENRPISAVEIEGLLRFNMAAVSNPARLYATMVTAANVLGQALGRSERQRAMDQLNVQPDVERHPFRLEPADGDQKS